MQAALRRIGIARRGQVLSATFSTRPRGMGGIAHGGKFDMLLYPWYAGIDPDDSSQFTCANVPPGGYNDPRYCIRRNGGGAARCAQRTTIRRCARSRYAHIQRLLARDNPIVFIWWQRQQEAISADFHGFDPNPVIESWNAWKWSI